MYITFIRAACCTWLTTPLLLGCGPSAKEIEAQQQQALRQEFQADKPIILARIDIQIEEKKFSAAIAEANKYRTLNDPDVVAISRKAQVGKAKQELSELPKSAAKQREALYRQLADLTQEDVEISKEYLAQAEHYAKIQAAHAAAEAQAREARKKQLLAGMKAEKDELEHITFYTDARTSALGKTIHLYIGEHPGRKPWLRMKVRYWEDDWLFVHSISVYADGEKFDRGPDDWERDNASGDVWEWIDVSPNDGDLRMLRALARSKQGTVRFHGQQYYHDFKVPQKDKDAIARVLDLFDALRAQT